MNKTLGYPSQNSSNFSVKTCRCVSATSNLLPTIIKGKVSGDFSIVFCKNVSFQSVTLLQVS